MLIIVMMARSNQENKTQFLADESDTNNNSTSATSTSTSTTTSISSTTTIRANSTNPNRSSNKNDDGSCLCGFAQPTSQSAVRKKLKNRKNKNKKSNRKAKNKIVNGYDPGSPRPWIAVFKVGKNEGQCGGSVINHELILTASHCFCYDNAKESFLCE